MPQSRSAMKATSHRRQLIVATLLALAIVGAGMRWWAGNPSLARDIGTLLLALWLPAVGNIVAFAIRRWRAAPAGGRGIHRAGRNARRRHRPGARSAAAGGLGRCRMKRRAADQKL